MPGCIITSVEGIASRTRMVQAADALGSKVMPQISQFCEFHHQHHLVRVEGAPVDLRYGHSPVEVSIDETKPDVYQHREFCNSCSSYHAIGSCRGARTRESVGS